MKKEYKGLKIIGNILYAILFIIAVLMLTVVILQRVSDNSLSLGGYRIFIVATGSMEPEYLVSDVLLAKEINPAEINVGDDVVYKGKEGTFKDRVVTHRVIEKSQENGTYKFITKGIANIEQDPQITGSQIYGRVLGKVKTLSYIGKVIQNIYIFYFFIFIPIALIIYRQIKNLVYDLTHKDEDEENK